MNLESKIKSMPDDKLKRLYHGSKTKIEQGNGNERTAKIYFKSRHEISLRALDAAALVEK